MDVLIAEGVIKQNWMLFTGVMAVCAAPATWPPFAGQSRGRNTVAAMAAAGPTLMLMAEVCGRICGMLDVRCHHRI